MTEVASPDRWRIKHAHHSLSDMDVLTIGPLNNPFTVMLHLPNSQPARLSFEQNIKICASLREDTRLSEEWRQLLPNLLHESRFQDRPYYIVERLPGISAAEVVLDSDKRQIALEGAFEAIGYLHQRTAGEVSVDSHLLESWVSSPLQAIRSSNLVYYHRQSRALLDRLELQLSEALLGKHLAVSRIHGDYWPANILLTPDGGCVTGIVDWDLSQAESLPSLDMVNLFLSTRQIEDGKELGQIMAEILRQGAWRKHEQALWEQARLRLGGKIPDIRESLLIFWLHHLNANLQKSRRYSVNPIWAYGNFAQVLDYLC